MATLKIAILIGSLRKESLTRKTAAALLAVAPKVLDCSIVEIGDLALYNEDLDSNPPAAWTHFRAQLARCNGVLFLTPEYNRSIPGCLKNALDVGSRPQGKSVFAGKPAGVVSVTPYKLGAFGANHALRQTFVFLDMPVMQQPEAYIAGAADLFDAQGALKSDETRSFFTQFMTSFAHWVGAVARTSQDEEFRAFMRRRAAIANSYVCGDAAPLETILPRTGDGTFFPPNGGSVHGAKEVAARYSADARSFAPGGTSELDVLQSGAVGDIAFWTGFQDAAAHLPGRKETTHMKLRITEVFRFQEGGWKVVHRHADPAAETAPRKSD